MIDIDKLSKQEVGKRIKVAREDRDIEQRVLAKAIGVSPPTLSKIESGAQDIRLDQLGQIANTLKTKIEFLLGIDKDVNFVDDFIRLFQRVALSKDFFAEDEKIYPPENLIYSVDREYIVLTGKPALFELIKEIAAINGLKKKLTHVEYESRLNAARNTYKETKTALGATSEEKRGDSKTYFLITGKQISEIVDMLVKGEKALSEIEVQQTNTDV